METLLNLCWAILAIAALSFWSARRRYAPASAFAAHTQLVALVCILILLFFPISLTDDLHPEILVMTDSFSQRRHLPILTAVKTPGVAASIGSIPPFLVAVPTQALFSGARPHSFIESEVPLPGQQLRRSAAPRSPPVDWLVCDHRRIQPLRES